jgi:hypothetical protein
VVFSAPCTATGSKQRAAAVSAEAILYDM